MAVKTKLSQLYELDETAWLEETARLIKERHFDELDRKHLAEYLEDMARRDRREVKHRLERLMMHLLKWEHQPEKRTRSWMDTIKEQLNRLGDLLESKSLKNYAKEVLHEVYARALDRAAGQTGLELNVFPVDCPFTVDGLLKTEVREG